MGTVDYRDAITRYYRAFQERDKEALRSLLTPEFHFISAFGEFHERDAMLDAIWPGVGQSWAVDIRIFGDGPELVALYRQETLPGAARPPHSMAERFRFEDGKIAEIEVFIGRATEGQGSM